MRVRAYPPIFGRGPACCQPNLPDGASVGGAVLHSRNISQPLRIHRLARRLPEVVLCLRIAREVCFEVVLGA